MSKDRIVFDTEWMEKDEWALDDERSNLRTIKTGTVFVEADLGLWNGRKPGYRLLEGDGGLDRIFDVFQGDFFSIYVDGKDLVGKDVHHDGTNRYGFFEVLDRESADEIAGLLCSGKPVPEELRQKGLRPLGPDVCNLYGWEISEGK